MTAAGHGEPWRRNGGLQRAGIRGWRFRHPTGWEACTSNLADIRATLFYVAKIPICAGANIRRSNKTREISDNAMPVSTAMKNAIDLSESGQT